MSREIGDPREAYANHRARQLRISKRDEPIATLARGVQPWLVRRLLLVAGTGVLLLISEAVKCYHIPSL